MPLNIWEAYLPATQPLNPNPIHLDPPDQLQHLAADMAKITDLANELLLKVASHARGRHRNSDLTSLSLVSRRFRPIAQEALLQEPCFKLGLIHLFMLEASRKDWVIPKIRSLELWSTGEDRYDIRGNPLPGSSPLYNGPRRMGQTPRAAEYTKIPCPPEFFARIDWDSFLATINHFSARPEHVGLWLSALNEDVIQGLLGILLVSLPNLKELRCAAVWLMDFPLLSNILSAEVTGISDPECKHGYLAGVINALAPKLEILEVPTNRWQLDFYSRVSSRVSSLFDFAPFIKLKELNISLKVLNYKYWDRMRLNPRAIVRLPPNLQVLRISEGELSTILLILGISAAKNTGRVLQSLERIEIFYSAVYLDFLRISSLHGWLNPIQDLREWCSSAQVSLSLYFPGVALHTVNADRSLWSLKDNQELLPTELKVFFRGDLSRLDGMDPHALDQMVKHVLISRKEISFDADGDIDMLDC